MTLFTLHSHLWRAGIDKQTEQTKADSPTCRLSPPPHDSSMQTLPFLTHYQLVCINFDFSLFSLISYRAIWVILRDNMVHFTAQYGWN